MATNFSVKALDLSHNMIGEKETYNFVRPDYTTGGEAVAEMLEVRSVLPYNCAGTNPKKSLFTLYRYGMTRR